MAKKTPRIVVSFHTTAEAMAFQKAAKADALQGRLAPIPRQLSAGCGLAWIEPAGNRDALVRCAEINQLEMESMVDIEL